jgi:hypothetical protein
MFVVRGISVPGCLAAPEIPHYVRSDTLFAIIVLLTVSFLALCNEPWNALCSFLEAAVERAARIDALGKRK